MERHAETDISATEGSLWQRPTSERGLTAISHYFVMDWASVCTKNPICVEDVMESPKLVE